jgi:hypothetical protein
MVEYEAVLTRPEHLAAAGLTATEVNNVLDTVAAVASLFSSGSCDGQD